ncbi:TRAP transporter small permease [Bordetella bronchiseptica]|uniref:TRAP transporter small permease n=1 Tax=Bordetella bronchiseptica TaxID=518 RepID=UPI00028A8B76|nr:TRAP transporter small permease [Bordetella bronchiseptica]KAK51250.1 TRAP transporter, DctQ-like membrane protein [Bordetella bronchiseptica OSU054]KAK71657.1 TRAP transporter, DctQ-like membrane protein [Bordetella bronchiseptica MO211]KDB72075.1 TRAP transporter, DctQ-like membrane protein [Bordetella bronchiseptica CA90 BB1334]KDC17291.1 TRAP transporter, DctQ-like membrane protein [Bordetella bronchiseptica F-1]KDC23782.1 TRAP transporter, DctQ-like membrane protein [Bordetella bronchi
MLGRISHALSGLSKAIAALAVALLAALITYVVFERFVMHTTPHWAEELPRLVLVWAAFIGGVTCSHERTHLMAGLLPFVVRNPRALAICDRVNQALIIVGLAALGYAGWQLAELTMDQTLPALDVSAGAVYLALPVACAITIVVHLAQLFQPADPVAAKD